MLKEKNNTKPMLWGGGGGGSGVRHRYKLLLWRRIRYVCILWVCVCVVCVCVVCGCVVCGEWYVVCVVCGVCVVCVWWCGVVCLCVCACARACVRACVCVCQDVPIWAIGYNVRLAGVIIHVSFGVAAFGVQRQKECETLNFHMVL